MNRPDTATLQHWLKTVIVTQGPLPYKVQVAQHKYQLDAGIIEDSHGKASVAERLNVYASGYTMRLLECMYADFPVLRKFTGNEVFDFFAKGYLHWKPSDSFTLYDLGKAFSEFLEKTKPANTALDETQQAMLELPIAMAQLERAIQETMRAPGTEEEENSNIAWEDILLQPLRLHTPPCLRLLELSFPLKTFYRAVRNSDTYDLPQPGKTYMAISRKNYRLMMEEPEPWQYAFLKNCTTGISLAEAVSLTAVACNLSTDTVFAELMLWLPVMQENGFICIAREY